MAEGLIKKICNGLARYYESFNLEYDKLFTIYCEDNGLDDDDVMEELQTDPTECVLVDFDEDFPFKLEPKDRERAILEILNKCHIDNNINLLSFIFDNNFFKMKEEELIKIMEIYKIQCPVLWRCGLDKDVYFQYILGIGYKNKYNYLQHLVDDYYRDRIKHIDKKKWLVQQDWKLNHKHLNILKNIKLTPICKIKDDEKNNNKNKIITAEELALTAVKLFPSRICPKLIFNECLIKINDSLQDIINYIQAGFTFISTIIINESSPSKTNRAICPFQLDICITIKAPIKCNDDDDDDENKDDDDDDDEDENEDEEEQEDNDDFVDCIGDIEKKLNANKLKYKLEEINASNKAKEKQRIFIRLFNKIELNEKEYSLNDNKFYNLHSKRLVAMVDRRRKILNNNDNNKDKVYLYLAPSDCRDIPNDAVSEWYLNASRTSLLPSTQNKQENIECSSKCKGTLLTISFHALSIDCIRCYLYWNGQITRFYADDIKTILPKIFNMKYQKNEEFINDTEIINDKINEMNKVLKDKQFDAFITQFQRK